MRKLFFLFLIVLFSSTIIFSQTATKIDELGYILCGDNYRLEQIFFNGIKDKPLNKIYVVYYEGQHEFLETDRKTKKYVTVIENPKFGNALNRAKEIPLFLQMVYKVPDNRIVLVNGGFRERFSMEIWSVSNGAEIPKSTPTLTRKDIKFAKGKPQGIRKMACCYESC